VNALSDDNMIVRQLADFTRHTLAQFEIEGWKLNGLALHQRDQILRQTCRVERSESLEVISAHFVSLASTPDPQNIFHRQRIRLDAVGHQLHCQAVLRRLSYLLKTARKISTRRAPCA